MPTEKPDVDPEAPEVNGEGAGTTDAVDEAEAAAVEVELDGDDASVAPARGSIAVPIESQGADEVEALDEDDLEVLDDDDLEMLDDDDLETDDSVAASALTRGRTAPPEVPHRPPPLPDGAAHDDIDELETIDVSVDREAPEAEAPALPPVPGLELPTVLERLLASGGPSGAERARDLEEKRDRSIDPERAALYAYELGELEMRILGDEAVALEAHRRALAGDPSLRANIWALRRICERRESWEELLELIAVELRFVDGDSERADLLVEKGQLLEDRLGRAGEARAVFEEALHLDPRCMGALFALERAAERDGDVEAREQVLRGLAEAVESPRRKLVYLLELAELRAQGGGVGALEALEILDSAASLEIERERVGRARERIAEIAEDWDAALAGLELQIEAHLERFGPAGPPSPQPRDVSERPDAPAATRSTIVALRRRQARIARLQHHDEQRAWDYLQQALVLLPAEPLLLADLADLAEKLGKYDELAELCAGWESQEADPLRSLSLSIRRAEALLHGGQLEEAGRLLASLAATAPGYLPITALLERDAITRLDWRGLAMAFAHMAHAAALGGAFAPGAGEHLDPVGAAGLYTIAGDLMASPAVDDSEEAKLAYGRALELDAGFPPAVEGLVALYERHGMFEETCQLLELQSETEDLECRRDYLHRLARLYQELGQFEDQVLVLRRLIAEETNEADRIGLRFRLEELLADLGKSEERLALLLQLADVLLDSSRQAAVLLEAARVAEFELDDRQRAITLYRRVLELDADDAFATEALLSAYRRLGMWSELVAQRRAEAAALADGPRLIRALREAAEVTRHELGKPLEAAQIYRELYDRVPGEESALHGLAGALAAAGDRGQATVLEQLAELRTEPAARAAALLRLGELYAVEGRASEASEVYRRVAEVIPASAHGGVAVAEYAQVQAGAAQVAEALEGLRNHRTDARLRARLSEHAGWLWLLQVGDLERAEADMLAACATDSGVAGPRLALALTRARMGETVAQGESLADLATALGPGYSAASLYLRSAVMAQVEGDTTVAAQRMAAARTAAPDDPGVLVVAADNPTPYDELDPVLAAEVLSRRGETLAARAVLAVSESARDSWELDAAEALERAGRLDEAAELVTGVLHSRPDDLRALRALRTLCIRGGDRAGHARASVALARILGDGHAKIELWTEAAEIFDRELGDTQSAVPIYRRILGVDPDSEVYGRLFEIYREAGDLGGMYDLVTARLNRFEERSERPVVRIALFMERSALRERMGDLKGAARDLGRVLQADPRHRAALERQWEILVRLGQVEAAARSLERYVEVEDDPGKRGEAEIQLSQLLAESLEDYTGAIVQLEHRLRGSDDEGDEVRDRLISYLIKSERWEQAIAELQESAGRRGSPIASARDFLRIAEIHRMHRGDPSSALAALERARQLDPLNLDMIRELAEIVGDLEDVRARNRVLRGAARDLRAAIHESPARAPLYERLAVVNRWLGEDEGRFFALSAYAALRTLSSEQRQFLADVRAQIAPLPESLGTPLTPDEWRTRVAHPGFTGVASELWVTLGPALDSIHGGTPEALGFGRHDKISGRALRKTYPGVAAVMEAFGTHAAEVFVSQSKKTTARVVGHDKPKVLLSVDVAEAKTPTARFQLGRAMAQARDGTAVLSELSDEDIRLYFAAIGRLAGLKRLPTDVTRLAHLGEPEADELLERYVRQLQKPIGRAERKSLAVASASMSELGDPALWKMAAMVTGACAGLLIGGDLAAALAVLDLGRGGRSVVDEPGALDFLAWTAGTDHLVLRAKLGLRETVEPTGVGA